MMDMLKNIQPGLWAKRFIVLCCMVYMGWEVYHGTFTTNSGVYGIVLIVVSFYFAQSKDQT